MSAVAAPAPAPAPAAGAPHLSFGHLLRSEWIKFWSVRSSVWTLGVMFVVMIGLVALIAGLTANDMSGTEDSGPVALIPFLAATQLAQLAVVVLGVLTITGEYTTGMIRSSLTAAPRRTPVYWSKMVVLGGSILVISAVAVAISAFISNAFFDPKGVGLDLGDSETVRVLVGNVLYITTIALFAFALGALMKHSAAAMATILGLLLIIENVLNAIPWEPLHYVAPLLPGSAGSRITQSDAVVQTINDQWDVGPNLSAWQGYGVLVAWVVVIIAIAAFRLKRKDA